MARPGAAGVRQGSALAAAAAFASGAVTSLQQRINGRLAVELETPVLAALLTFASAMAVVLVVVLARPRARRALPAVRSVSWPARLAGLGSVPLVVVGAFATPLIGVALLTVALVAGQIAGGLVLDGQGASGGGRRRMTLPRVCGALLCLAAVGLGALGHGARDVSIWLVVVMVGAGALVAVQRALNGQVRRTTGDAAVTTLLTFAVGTVALSLGALALVLLYGSPDADWPGLQEWYLYLGGPLGATCVAVAVVTVRPLGVLRLGLAVVAGQVVGALALDVAAPAVEGAVSATTVLSALLTVAAVAVSGLRPATASPAGVARGERP